MNLQQCLKCMDFGSCFRVQRVRSSHPSARKLRAMGMDEGCAFYVERVSPFGDPCIIRLKGTRLALRRRDFEAMELEPAEGAGA